MELIRPFERLGKGDAGIVGGKGASLGEMTQAGIPVPPGFVLLADAFEKFLEEADLNQELDAILHTVNKEEIRSVEFASERIQTLIRGAKMPEDIASEIVANFKKLDTEFVAVRSSATAEDGATAAWAGQLDTFLNTTEENVLENVQKCWASLFTPRAIFYRFEKRMHGQKISVAVVVQKMVQSEVSGIAFSVHPVTEDYNQMIIEAGFGLGEAIVSGQVTPDSFVLEKVPRRIIDKNITYQSKALWRGKGGSSEWRESSEEEGRKPALSDSQALELAEIVLKIEKHYGFPCDIEWAFEAGKFFITQSRPITTLALKSGPKTIGSTYLSRTYARERPLYYLDLWQEVDRITLGELFGSEFNNVLIVFGGGDKKTAIWLNTADYERMKGLVVQEFAKGKKSTAWPKTEKLLTGGWKQLKPYTSGDKKIQTNQECLEYLDSLEMFWSGMNTIVFEVAGDEGVPAYMRTFLKNTRSEMEHYTEDLATYPGKYFANTFSKYSSFMHVMTLSEIKKVLQGQEITDIATLESRLNGCFILNGQIYNKLPSLESELRRLNLAMWHPGQSGTVKGTSAYPGIVRGTARLVDGISDLGRVKRGDVLVTQMTDPRYMPAIHLAAAVVTDEGGMLCHAAITARELKKPSIIGTQVATDLIKDGDMVEVDANAGIVRKL